MYETGFFKKYVIQLRDQQGKWYTTDVAKELAISEDRYRHMCAFEQYDNIRLVEVETLTIQKTTVLD